MTPEDARRIIAREEREQSRSLHLREWFAARAARRYDALIWFLCHRYTSAQVGAARDRWRNIVQTGKDR